MTLEGYKELYVNLDKHEKAATKAAMEGLKRAGMNIIADAKENLRANGSMASGNLRKSGKVQKVDGDKDSLDVGFFVQGKDTGYAYFVEYGRRSGKMPPPQDLIEWIRKKNKTKGAKSALNSFVLFKNANARKHKNRTAEDFLLMAARALAFHIGKHGTRPHPFFAPAVEKNKASIEDAISESVKEIL